MSNKQIRDRQDDPTTNRAVNRIVDVTKLRELFNDYDVDKYQGYMGARMVVEGLPDTLHAKFVDMSNAKQVARAQKLGYKPLEEVTTRLGMMEDGVFTHPKYGDKLKVFVCLQEQRERRNAVDKKSRKQVSERVFSDMAERPMNCDRRYSNLPLPANIDSSNEY
jgi:hypothetical protein